MDLTLITKLAISLGLGLLVGFQREWSAPHVAGLRTFAFITLLGTVLAQLVATPTGWPISAGLLSVVALIIMGNFLKSQEPGEEHGLTTSVAGVLMYVVGVAVGLDQLPLGIFLTGIIVVLLQWKQPLHGFVERFGEGEIRGISQLVLVALVVLPALPNEDYGPYGLLNPFEIWLMVVLICGISLGGYIAYKCLGAQAGTILAGILGGMISSTATTVSYSRRSNRWSSTSNSAALVIMIASTVVFGRVIFEIAVVAPQILWELAPPLVLMMFLMAVISAALYVRGRGSVNEVPLEEDDPAELKAAIVFGLLYATVLLAVAVAKENFGDRGLYVVAMLSGLTDMDAITLSTAQMIQKEELTTDIGWRMILIGALSNLVFKGAAVVLLGSRALLRMIAVAFGTALVGGVLLLVLWP